MKKIKYKLLQENILIDLVSSSSFITKEMLYDIKKYYNFEVPYHNFLHVLYVASKVLELNSNNFNIVEIKSLFFAALFHDAGHTGQASLLDEFSSLDIALKYLEEFEKKYDIGFLDKSIIRKSIIGTVFANRGKFTDKFAKILGDFDIGSIGGDFMEFCYYSFPFCYELNQKEEDFLSQTEINYFRFLINIDKKILLTKYVRDILPNSLINMKKFLNTDKKILVDMLKTIKNEDIIYDDFVKKFDNLV